MNITYPLTLDRPVIGTNNSGQSKSFSHIASSDLAQDWSFAQRAKGHDSSANNSGSGTRITNISGIQKADLLKWCPHCKLDKPQGDFGDAGRTTNEFRDQSHCTECRVSAF